MWACFTSISFKWRKRKWTSTAQRTLTRDELASKTTQCPPQEGNKNKGPLFVRCLKVGSEEEQEVGKMNP